MTRSSHPQPAHAQPAHPQPAHPQAAQLTAGVFTINYTLFTNAEPNNDIQFGMDFTLTSTTREPLCQLIFPATNVGKNTAGKWNVDNHNPALVFNNAAHGTITDTPREPTARHRGIKTTKFAVYLIDEHAGIIKSSGVQFGYKIDTNAAHPETIFTGFATSKITNEQKTAIQTKDKGKFKHIKFV